MRALSTGLNSTLLGPWAGMVNEVVLGVDAPFACQSLPSLWYTAAEARTELSAGLPGCVPYAGMPAVLTAFLACHATFSDTATAEAMLAYCFGRAVPPAFQPRKIAQAGKSVKRALRARLGWLQEDLRPIYDDLQRIFPASSSSGSGTGTRT